MLSMLKTKILEYIDNPPKTPLKKIDFYKYVFEKQRIFISDTSKRVLACCSRRAGKSTAVAYLLVKTALQENQSDCVYLTKTRESGKEILWDVLKDILRELDILCTINETTLTINIVKHKSKIKLRSANDRKSIEKLRGLKLRLVVIDEAQMFGDYLYDLIQQVLDPTLRDLQGQLFMTGTPPAHMSGHFVDCVLNKKYSLHKWTWRDNIFFIKSALKKNPKHQNAEDIFEEILNDYQLPIDHPIIQREWFGNLVRSDDLLVYKYRKDVNDCDGIQQVYRNWNYVMGVDIGFEDASAIVILGFPKNEKKCYLVHESKFSHANISQLAAHIQTAYNTYRPYYSVMDAGALGKTIQSELNCKFSFYLEAAEKSRKAEYIAMANDELLLGRVKIPYDSSLSQEMERLVWDENKYKDGVYREREGLDNHLCDAFLYAFRKAYHYLSEPEEKKISKYSEEWLIQQETNTYKEPDLYGF